MTSLISQYPPMTYFQLVTDRWSEPYWAATAEHRLEIPRCGDCSRFQMPPAPFCPACQSSEQEWVEVNGKGSIYSFTLITNPPFAEAIDHLPYAPVLVELDDAPGVRIVSAVVDAPLDAITIGARVELCWQDIADGQSVPRFRLA